MFTLYYLLTFSLNILPIQLWTDFSKTVKHSNGLNNIIGLKAYCSQSHVLRGLEFNKPTSSTLRLALQCVKLHSEVRYRTLHNVSPEVPCDSNLELAINELKIQCANAYLLTGFSLESYNDGKCQFHFWCTNIEGAWCYNDYFSSDTYDTPYNHPIIVDEYYSGLNGWYLEYNKDKYQFKYNYCLIPKDVLDGKEEKVKTVDIEYYIDLDDINNTRDLNWVLKEIFHLYKGLVAFTPYFVSVDGKEDRIKRLICAYRIWKNKGSDDFVEVFLDVINGSRDTIGESDMRDCLGRNMNIWEIQKKVFIENNINETCSYVIIDRTKTNHILSVKEFIEYYCEKNKNAKTEKGICDQYEGRNR